MPGPLYFRHDYKASSYLASTIGIFSPIPSLSCHRHRDQSEVAVAPPDFPVLHTETALEDLARKLDFPRINLSECAETSHATRR